MNSLISKEHNGISNYFHRNLVNTVFVAVDNVQGPLNIYTEYT